jgi:hypothetical protein
MKKYLIMTALFLFLVLGMKTGVMAQNQALMSVNMFKDVSSNGETYGITFDLSGDVLKKVTRVYIKGPKGARIWVNNTLDLNDMVLSAVNLPLDEFNRWFPEGKYNITLTPKTYGTLSVSMTHDFPSTPAVLSPSEGSTNVLTNPLITWTPLTGIIGLRLQLKDDADFLYRTSLPVNATFFAVPANVLNPNTRYELSLQAKVTDLSGLNGLNTTTINSFTTGAK